MIRKGTRFALSALLMVLASVHLAGAQQAKKVPRIGYVSGIGDSANPGPNVEVFRQGLGSLKCDKQIKTKHQ
jgi:hypothetical protein